MNEYYKGEPKLLVSVDCIVLGFEDKKLKLLVGKRKVEPGRGKLSLYYCTGICDNYIRQVGAFGDIDRDPGDRVISIAYCALTNVADYDKNLLAKYDLKWVDLNKLPDLYGDHIEMVKLALAQLRKLLNTEPISFNLLPHLFTLTQLQHVHEAILGVEIDKRNFRKKIKLIDFIERTELIDKVTSKRGAALYRFNRKTYKNSPTFKL